MDYIALFFTTSGAVKFKKKLEKQNISAESLPVPRRLSSSCGIAVKFNYDEKPESLLDDSVEKIYQIIEKEGKEDYALIFEAE